MRLSSPLSLLFALGCCLPAQSFDLRSAHGIVRDDHGTPWSIGGNYKASVTPSGVTFVPALGMRAPVTRELSLRLERVTRGASTVWTAAPSMQAATRVQSAVITIDRGTFVEKYSCRADGVEQSFVFAERPAGAGDLVVRCALTTTLQPTTRGDGTLFFHDGSVGGVTVGAVTGIAADGRSVGGSLQLRDGALELRLPASFVDSASYPMTLDPLLATGFLIGDPVANEDQVDAAYGSGPGTTLVVWRRIYSYWNQDILGHHVASDGSLSGSLLAITLAPNAERLPSVSYVRGRDRHVVCWLEGSSPIGPWTVRARTIDGTTLGPMIVVSGTTSPNGVAIATSGDHTVLGTKTLVVWATPLGTTPYGEQTTLLRTNTVEVGLFGSLTAGTPADLSSALGSSPSDSVFALPRSRAPGGVTALAKHVPGSNNAHSVYALDYDGGYLGDWVHVSTTDPAKAPFVAIDGDGTDFVVACRRYDGETIVRQITWNGTSFTSGTNVSVLGLPTSSSCAVGFLGERFLVAWSEAAANPFDSDIRGVALTPSCELCSSQFTLATVARPNAIAPAIASVYSGGGTEQTALLAWDETNVTTGFTSSVAGQHFAAMVGAPPVTLSPGCGNGGTASAVGAFAPGNERFKFKLTGGDPTAPFALISLGLAGASIPCGCELTNYIVLQATFAVNGTAEWPFVPWCDPSYLGTQIEFQWLLLGAAQSPCPLVPNLAASNRVMVTLTP